MKIFGSFLLALLLFVMAAAAADAVSLDMLDGENLSRWYIWIKDRGRDQDPKQVFTIKDGVLRVSGEEWGCITSQDEFSNYHLLVEYKWGT
ncbi:MAG: DUF1080 domain-containing protein, partial [Candidatus Hydrogenedentes bacterium]|nr:DUF1080 domain-containing protein [Candidatus Hydrogenedentota bacterium]